MAREMECTNYLVYKPLPYNLHCDASELHQSSNGNLWLLELSLGRMDAGDNHYMVNLKNRLESLTKCLSGWSDFQNIDVKRSFSL